MLEKKKLFIFLMHLDYGGIETNILKLSNLLDNFYDVTIVYIKGHNPEFKRSFSKSIKIINIYKFINLALFKNNYKSSIFFSTGRYTLVFSILISYILGLQTRNYLCIYSQFEFFERIPFYLKFFFTFFLHLITINNISFCTIGFKKIAFLKNTFFTNATILPLAISYPLFCRIPSSKNCIKIVTISRFVRFKRYLFHLINSVKELSKIYDIHLDIYGYGPLKNKLIKNIDNHSSIKIHGKINLESIDNVLLDTDIFVGSGSIVIETSSRAIPTIVAIDDDFEGYSSGFFYELPDNYISEFHVGMKKYKIHELLSKFLYFDHKPRLEMAKLSHLKALNHDSNNIILNYVNFLI